MGLALRVKGVGNLVDDPICRVVGDHLPGDGIVKPVAEIDPVGGAAVHGLKGGLQVRVPDQQVVDAPDGGGFDELRVAAAPDQGLDLRPALVGPEAPSFVQVGDAAHHEHFLGLLDVAADLPVVDPLDPAPAVEQMKAGQRKGAGRRPGLPHGRFPFRPQGRFPRGQIMVELGPQRLAQSCVTSRSSSLSARARRDRAV